MTTTPPGRSPGGVFISERPFPDRGVSAFRAGCFRHFPGHHVDHPPAGRDASPLRGPDAGLGTFGDLAAIVPAEAERLRRLGEARLVQRDRGLAGRCGLAQQEQHGERQHPAQQAVSVRPRSGSGHGALPTPRRTRRSARLPYRPDRNE